MTQQLEGGGTMKQYAPFNVARRVEVYSHWTEGGFFVTTYMDNVPLKTWHYDTRTAAFAKVDELTAAQP